MTPDQLAIFIAVAERQHVTRAAEALNLTPSAVSSAIRSLENRHNVRLFDRVGRHIELTATGTAFLDEARAVLARLRAAESMLEDLGQLRRGRIVLHASQTIGNHWLPEKLMAFHALYPAIEMSLRIGNSEDVSRALLAGEADLGFVEGNLDHPSLRLEKVGADALVIVVPRTHSLADQPDIPLSALASETGFVMRERGSGTRSEFETALAAMGMDPARLRVVLELSSNEALLSALRGGHCAAAVSRLVARPLLETGELVALPFPFPDRTFSALLHRERHISQAVQALLDLCRETLLR